MNHPLHVCVCIPTGQDNRPAAEQAETLERFRALDDRIQFHFAEYVNTQDVRTLRAREDHQQARARTPEPSPALVEALAVAEVILAVDLPFDMDRLAPNLRWVQSVGGGVGQLQTCGLDRLGATLTSGAGVLSDSIAEFALARILAHWKHFDQLQQRQREHHWQALFGRGLAGSVLGIVGYGAIGRALAWRAKAWGMTVLATKRQLPRQPDPAVDRFYPAEQVKELLAASDAVVLSAAETPDTRGMFDDTLFTAIKPGGYFCNVARGSLVDEDALRRALDSGHLAGASIDVASREPLPPDSPLWDTPNLAISAHCSPSVERFYHGVWELFHDNMRRYLAGEPMRNLRASYLGRD